ncbi:class I SAM-dependent methyltransferase [Thermodesulfobacteriota bacterium]
MAKTIYKRTGLVAWTRPLMGWLCCLVLALSAISSSGWASGPETAIEPSDVRRIEARIKRLAGTGRDKWLKPDQVLSVLQLSPGQIVADIGSGPGYFSLRFARAVGPTGRVYSVDTEPYFLAELERSAEEEGLKNISTILVNPDKSSPPPGAFDLVFFSSAYHHIKDRAGYLQQLRTQLNPGARIAIIGKSKIHSIESGRNPEGKMSPRARKGLDPEQVVRELDQAGFVISARPEFIEGSFFLIATSWN